MSNDTGTAGFLLLLGVTVSVEAGKLPFGNLSSPGPGFFPFCLALALCIVGLLFLLHSLAAARAGQNVSPATESGRRGKAVWTLLVLLGYAAGLEPMGFLAATFLLMLLLYGGIERRRWSVAAGGSLLTTVLAYALFRLLQVRLPEGLWAP